MASGSYAKKASPQAPDTLTTNTSVPLRARRTSQLEEQEERYTHTDPDYQDEKSSRVTRTTNKLPENRTTSLRKRGQDTLTLPETRANLSHKNGQSTRVLPESAAKSLTSAPPKKRQTHPNMQAPKPALTTPRTATPRANGLTHSFIRLRAAYKKPRVRLWIICTSCIVVSLLVLILAGINQRSDNTQVVLNGGQTYTIQVEQALKSNSPLPIKSTVKMKTGPYNVLGKPTLTVSFINQVLTSYNSPAAGQGQALYDLGVKYEIDPAFALAFFMHESSFGTEGEAKITHSLGNLRCINDAACVNTAGDTCQPGDSCYASFPNWQGGFEAWYKLIRNLYVAQWGLNTVDSIIPVYAPPADNNNDNAYIAGLKHELDTWHSGQIFVN